MFDIKSICHLTILLLSFCFMLVHCSLEPTDQFLDNPTDVKQDVLTMHKRPSFFVGSRYGRSSGGASSSSVASGAYAPSKTRRLNVVPRNDRFFLGSRYGKRAGTQFENLEPMESMLATPYEQALFSEISTGTQLSNKPAAVAAAAAKPLMLMNNEYSAEGEGDAAAGGASTPYMSCVYTGLQNFYRCNSIDDNMFYVKNTVKNHAAYQNYNNNNYNNADNDVRNDVDETDDDDETKTETVNSAVDNDDYDTDADADGGNAGRSDGVVNEVLSTDATEAVGNGIGGDNDLAVLFNDVNGKN
ncbi:uncharacterized protein LOC101891749 isoform X1 [Musca domestica]|uniref:Uncharacterized protein LOC101891749 isoform X1 n=1 Tax=Musca domestica TaxID=7370 RepID=A0A1I8MEM8_MUSDO|nr:uncharacterized protein LOC101891749 isoform X1 [Musca domestica]XP_058976094.1 uncharacterized protein LOC101891749 isoform X1 [Musca domestica]XP_058976095.1 uncharacterized protein LOC101891749 isoform X1 [Musca domestica]